VTIILEWLADVEEVLRKGQAVKAMHRRLVAPAGTRPPRANLVKSVKVDILERPGMPSESLIHLMFPATLKYRDGDIEAGRRLSVALGALICYVLDRRVELLDEWLIGQREDNELLWTPMMGVVDRRLQAPNDDENFSTAFEDSISRLLSCKGKDAEAILAAIELHHAASRGRRVGDVKPGAVVCAWMPGLIWERPAG
jgi:hypothetical protein